MEIKTLWTRRKKFFLIYGGVCCGAFALMILAVLFMDYISVYRLVHFKLYDLLGDQAVLWLGLLLVLACPTGLMLMWKFLVDQTWMERMPLLWGFVGGGLGAFIVGIIILSPELVEGASFSVGYYFTIIFGAIGVFGAFFLMVALSQLKSGKYEEEEVFKWTFFLFLSLVGVVGGPKEKHTETSNEDEEAEALAKLEHLREQKILSEEEFEAKKKQLEEHLQAKKKSQAIQEMIRELELLKKRGVLTEEEFEEKKKKLTEQAVPHKSEDKTDKNADNKQTGM